jgi:tripartite-type tricarboxylate transporter receptor subunit TctC
MRNTLLGALALTVLCVHGGADAQGAAATYPAKTVRIIVGYQPGGPTDMTARLVAARLQTALGQPFVVENRPGAGSNIASEYVAGSAPDGYTLLVSASQLTWNSVLYKNLKFDPIKSFAPISRIMSAPAVLAVNPSLPAKNVAELVALARAKPGQLSFSSSGNGSVPHLAGELFKQRAGIDIMHVPYRGAGQATSDLLGGQVSMSFMTALSALPHFREGKLRPLAVTAKQRLPQLPDVPTMAEAGVAGVEVDSWNGLFAPAGTPKGIIDKLHREVAKALAASDVRKTFEEQAATVIGNSPSEFADALRREVEQNAAFIKSINLKLE